MIPSILPSASQITAFIAFCGFIGGTLYLILEGQLSKIFMTKEKGKDLIDPIVDRLIRVEEKLDQLLLRQTT